MQTKITKQTLNYFNEFVINTDSKLLNRTLRNMLIDYLQFNKDGLPLDFNSALHQISLLFNLLDVITDEQRRDKT
jgi:hypothetical protein